MLLAACATQAPPPAREPVAAAPEIGGLRIRPRRDTEGDCAATPVPGAGRQVGALTFEAGFELIATDGRFGGLSGLEALDAETLLAVTDDGGLVEIAVRDGADPICRITDLRDAAGAQLRGKDLSDAEGLALIAPDGIAVSFEREHRIAVFELGDAAREIGEAIDFSGADDLESNLGIEALALLPSGELLAGAELPTLLARPHPVWRLSPVGESFEPAGRPAFRIATESGFGLVGLDATPRGGLVVLQRFWSEPLGNRIRVGWLAPGVAETATGRMRPQLLARLTGDEGIGIDNFEGIAALDAGDGRTTIWIASDDNFNAAQRTLLYRFSFDEAAMDGSS